LALASVEGVADSAGAACFVVLLAADGAGGGGQVVDEAARIDMLRAMDIFVLPSTVEGLSLSLLEAMACGVAAVATDVGSDGEALRGAGMVIDMKDLEGQLRLALRTLIEYPEFRAELGRRARTRALERYSLATNLDQLLTLYQRASAGGRRRRLVKTVSQLSGWEEEALQRLGQPQQGEQGPRRLLPLGSRVG